MKEVEYRVRPVTRYVVTRWYKESGPEMGVTGSECIGEFDNAMNAQTVALALVQSEPGSHFIAAPNWSDDAYSR